jgi:hypothetical protein
MYVCTGSKSYIVRYIRLVTCNINKPIIIMWDFTSGSALPEIEGSCNLRNI